MVRDYDNFRTDGVTDIERLYTEQFGQKRAEEIMEEDRYREKAARAYKNLMIDFLMAKSQM